MNALSARNDQLEHYIEVEQQVVAKGGDDADLLGFEAELETLDYTWDKLSRQADKQDAAWDKEL